MSDTHLTAPTRFIEVDGDRFAYRRWGKPSGVPLFFVPHFRAGLDHWDPQLTDGLAAGREVILFNGRGIASSTGKPRNRIEDLADDIALAIRALGLSNVDLLGFSIGGLQVQEVALRHPQFVRKLLLLGTGLRSADPTIDPRILEVAPKPVPTVEDFLFFGRSEAAKQAGRAFWDRRHLRVDQDPPSSAEVARAQARRGYDLVLVARDAARLEELATPLRADTGITSQVLHADLTQTADLARVEQRLRSDARITMLVNNASVAAGGPLVGGDLDRLEAMIDLHVVAVTRLASAAATNFANRGAGILINLSSVLALAPEQFNAVYSATKAYILNLSLALQQELSPSGVQVQVVLPGATRTAICGRAGIDIASLPASMLMEVEEMVDAALVGLDRREVVTIPSLPDSADWQAYTAARLDTGPNLSRQHAADRYKAVDHATANA